MPKFKPSTSRHLPITRETVLNEGLLQPRKALEKDDSTDSSQQTNYDYFGDNDITDLIMAIECTQPAEDEIPPHSNISSQRSLGKRKASDLSSMSSSSTLFRPSKIPRHILTKEDEDNPFLESPEIQAEDLTGPICLSPSQVLQNLFTAKKLPYGAQYEINRLVSVNKLTYDDILYEDIDKLAKLGTNREAAPATAKLMLKHSFEDDESDEYEKIAFAKEHSAKSPWEEFDREEEALGKSPYGGLGFDENNEPLGWHGGHVLFHAKLHDMARDRKSSKYKLTLEPAELSSSYSFARRFGSKHFLRMKLTKGVLNKSSKQLLDYVRRPLILCGSVFRAFFAKENNVFYVKTNEGTNGKRILSNALVPNVMSFLEFINWHNPIELNSKQTMAKYASRFALGLSNSVPGVMVNRSNLHFIQDIISPETQSNMTDGAGKTNRWTLKQLRHHIEWEDKPTAIQTRIYGTKGLLVEDVRNAEEFSYVELTPSQRKIVYPSGVAAPDPAHCIIDVLRASHAKSPCRLSVEIIINLWENGVPKIVFLDLLRQGLKELVEPLLEWEGPHAMRDLWCNMRRLGGVMSARRAREDTGLARVKGYSAYESEEVELEDEDGFKLLDATELKSTAWWRDEISGSPSSLEETVMCLIDSGFTPQSCPVLRSRLEKVVQSYVKNYIKSYRIDVPMSASAFLIPDTLGVLEPGEIFFKNSRNKFLTLDGLGTDVLLGTVLVTRHPCKLPTDVQKWKAVDKPELHHLVDVVVLSTKGSRRAADLLSGGDYDGDKGLVIFQPEVVEAFKESPLHYSEPPPDIKSYFKRENEEVVSFLARVAPLDDVSKVYELQGCLLGAIRDTSVVGKYSNFHENATYTLGYTHRETIRLAYMFCMALDGFKTGMTVRDDILKQDTKSYQKRPPKWKETDEDRDRFHASGQNEQNLQRPKFLGRFIMDELHKQAKDEGDQWLARIENHFERSNQCKIDEDLVTPWNKAMELSKRWATEENNTRMQCELEAIAEHVKSVYKDHRGSLASPSKISRNSPKKGALFSGLPIEIRQDSIRKVSKQFVSFPPPGKFFMQDEEIARLRASYAYKYDHEVRHSGWTRFPWDVAMRELGAIKARATGGHKTIAGEFYDHFNMKHSRIATFNS